MSDLKVDQVKYGKLRDEHVEIHKDEDGSSISVIHTPTGINVSADSRTSYRDNWELAQQALNSALEHQESIGMTQPETKGHL